MNVIAHLVSTTAALHDTKFHAPQAELQAASWLDMYTLDMYTHSSGCLP